MNSRKRPVPYCRLSERRVRSKKPSVRIRFVSPFSSERRHEQDLARHDRAAHRVPDDREPRKNDEQSRHEQEPAFLALPRRELQ
jgi:endogenous inhibitor of DNA gyrase (YacG/DUF329 family)